MKGCEYIDSKIPGTTSWSRHQTQSQNNLNSSGERLEERARSFAKFSEKERLENNLGRSEDLWNNGTGDIIRGNERNAGLESISENETGEIKNVRVVYDAFEGDTKGIRFYIDFTAWNAGGRTFLPCVFFYDENGEKLRDTDNSFCSADGQVSVSGERLTANSKWAGSKWSDYRMFIPIEQTDIKNPGRYNLIFQVNIFDVTNSDNPIPVAKSDQYGFKYTIEREK